MKTMSTSYDRDEVLAAIEEAYGVHVGVEFFDDDSDIEVEVDTGCPDCDGEGYYTTCYARFDRNFGNYLPEEEEHTCEGCRGRGTVRVTEDVQELETYDARLELWEDELVYTYLDEEEGVLYVRFPGGAAWN